MAIGALYESHSVSQWLQCHRRTHSQAYVRTCTRAHSHTIHLLLGAWLHFIYYYYYYCYECLYSFSCLLIGIVITAYHDISLVFPHYRYITIFHVCVWACVCVVVFLVFSRCVRVHRMFCCSMHFKRTSWWLPMMWQIYLFWLICGKQKKERRRIVSVNAHIGSPLRLTDAAQMAIDQLTVFRVIKCIYSSWFGTCLCGCDQLESRHISAHSNETMNINLFLFVVVVSTMCDVCVCCQVCGAADVFVSAKSRRTQ